MKFLVIGAGRGGTSLLMSLLDAHSKLELGYEIHAIDCLMGFDLTSPNQEIRGNLAYFRSQEFLNRCNNSAKQHPNKYWGNKITTEQLYGLEDHNIINVDVDVNHVFFKEILGSDIKVIFILRDGRTCIRSKISRTGQWLEHAIQRWRYSVSVWRYLSNHHHNALILKYEDLVSNPNLELEKICQFLEIDYEKEMLSGTDNSKIRQEYRSNSIQKENLSLKGYPKLCLNFILKDLLDTKYINLTQYWYLRLSHSLKVWYGFGVLLSIIILISLIL